MKLVKIIVASIISGLVSISCSTTEKFSLSAPSGTEVYNPAYTVRPLVEGEGGNFVKVEVTSDMYLGYLLYKPAGSSVMIPYGVDYVTKNHIGTKAAFVSGFGLASVGIGIGVAGTIMVLSGDEEVQSTGANIMVAGGLLPMCVGAALGVPSSSRLHQTAYDYNFGYAKKQTVNLPELSMTLINPNPTKEELASPAPVKTERKKATSSKASTADKKTDKGGSKVSRTRTDVSKKIAGEYVGKGRLLLKGVAEETYNSIIVTIESIDKNHVSVKIVEGGEDFFEEPLVYTVSSDKKGGGFSLVIDEFPDATIKITKSGVMTFNHRNVNIDDVIYTLTISANKH